MSVKLITENVDECQVIYFNHINSKLSISYDNYRMDNVMPDSPAYKLSKDERIRLAKELLRGIT